MSWFIGGTIQTGNFPTCIIVQKIFINMCCLYLDCDQWCICFVVCNRMLVRFSYDSWIPSSECDQEPEEPPQRTKPWEINGRWVIDLDIYNEWMNEEDYEIESDVSATVLTER